MCLIGTFLRAFSLWGVFAIGTAATVSNEPYSNTHGTDQVPSYAVSSTPDIPLSLRRRDASTVMRNQPDHATVKNDVNEAAEEGSETLDYWTRFLVMETTSMTAFPSLPPTLGPTTSPTQAPSASPSLSPSTSPSPGPSTSPSYVPTPEDSTCTANVTDFTASLLFDFAGPIGLVNTSNIAALELVLKDAYNSVAGCDQTDAFIVVDKVTIDIDIADSFGDNIETGDDERVDFTWLVSFEGTCRGCATDDTADPPLFDDTNPGTCACHFPTVEAYTAECNERLETFPLGNGGSGLLSLVRVTPFLSVPGTSTSFFATPVLVTGRGGLFALGDFDLLARYILEVYNALSFFNFRNCDPEERIVTSVVPNSIMEDEDPDDGGTTLFSVIFNIVGSCRDCGQTTVVFGPHQVDGNGGSDFSCPAGSILSCPTEEEFEETLERILASTNTTILTATDTANVTLSPTQTPRTASPFPSFPPSSSPSKDPGPFCIDFVCEEGFLLRENPETRPGDDRATCCFRAGVCAGVPVNGTCSLGDIGASLIPNPSFENFTSCPTTFSQLNFAVTWVQATRATSDYWVGGPTCLDTRWRNGLGGIGRIPQEATDGHAFVGSIKLQTSNYYEYIGACLNAPLLAGTPYTFNLDIAAATDSGSFGGDTNGVTELLCIPNCDAFQISGVDYKGDEFEVLSTAAPATGLVGGGNWTSITFEVTPTTNCDAVMFGPGLDQSIQSSEMGSYVIYDFLNLQEGIAGVCNDQGECVPA